MLIMTRTWISWINAWRTRIFWRKLLVESVLKRNIWSILNSWLWNKLRIGKSEWERLSRNQVIINNFITFSSLLLPIMDVCSITLSIDSYILILFSLDKITSNGSILARWENKDSSHFTSRFKAILVRNLSSIFKDRKLENVWWLSMGWICWKGRTKGALANAQALVQDFEII